MTQVVLSLGSNIERKKNIHFALKELVNMFGTLDISPVYETQAVGFEGPDFYNLVVVLDTDLELKDLMSGIRRIEMDAGRIRGEKSLQSRHLDIDILLFGDADLRKQGRNIPRTEIDSAAYVLKPLADILPKMRHPVSGRCFEALWQAFGCGANELRRIDFKFDHNDVA